MKSTLTLAAVLLFPLTAGAAAPDQEFFDKAAIAGMFEVQSSELAMKQSTDTEIVSFAKMMVADHGKANAKLKALAMKKGVTLPSTLDKDHQDNLDKLGATKPGKDFNEAYADLMEDGHDDAVELFEEASKDAKDKDVRAFAAETLPTLKMHSEHAEKLDKKDLAP